MTEQGKGSEVGEIDRTSRTESSRIAALRMSRDGRFTGVNIVREKVDLCGV